MTDARRTLRILVVEDHPEAAAVLALMFRLDGHEVRTAADGLSALAMVESDPPDVVICDIGLPGLDGYAVARRVRELTGPGGVKLIAITGRGSDEDRARSKEAGFDYHLIKPVDPAELDELLRTVLRQDQ